MTKTLIRALYYKIWIEDWDNFLSIWNNNLRFLFFIFEVLNRLLNIGWYQGNYFQSTLKFSKCMRKWHLATRLKNSWSNPDDLFQMHNLWEAFLSFRPLGQTPQGSSQGSALQLPGLHGLRHALQTRPVVAEHPQQRCRQVIH